MRSLLVAGVLLLLTASSAGSSDTLTYHWPRVTTGAAQITVFPSTDPGHALDAGYYADLRLAVDNWNLSSKVHLTVASPQPCYWQLSGICVMGDAEYPVTRGGWASLLVTTYPYIAAAQVHVNTASIPPSAASDPPSFWESMILCHEIGEALGLPDPSDDPVTATVAPTCLTRDYNMLTSIPSDANFAQLDVLYGNADSPPVACKGKKCR